MSVSLAICIHMFTHYNNSKYDLIITVYYACGVVLLVCAIAGVVAGHLRYRRLLQAYIIGLTIVSLCNTTAYCVLRTSTATC
jgi:hypothetical protein